MAATTHIPLPRTGLTQEQIEGRDAARARELQSLDKNDTYERVPISEVSAAEQRSAIPTSFVDTEKRVSEGERVYKGRLVANGNSFFDRRQNVTTSATTTAQHSFRIALTIAFAHSGFDPRNIMVADIETAYLTALRSDTVKVIPPKDHPDHGKFLWRLKRAIYGLGDSGNIFDRSHNKVLVAAGWVPSGINGLWWKWTGRPQAARSRLLGLLPTFVDDLAVIPIGTSAEKLIREIAAKGNYTMKITRPKGGQIRWSGVDFSFAKDSVCISQIEYLLSLPLPEGQGDPVPAEADVIPLPPSSREPQQEPAPLLSAADATAFRERLGALSWVARDTRPDLAEGCNQLSRHACAPTRPQAEYLLHLLRYARRTVTSRVLQIRRSDIPSLSTPLSLKGWSDASLGCPGNAHPHTGWLFAIGLACLHWRSFTQKRVARSSTRAELYAAHDLVDFLEHLLPTLRCVWREGVSVTVGVDSGDVLKLVFSEAPRPTERALQRVVEELQLHLLEKSPETLVLHCLAVRDALDEAAIKLSFVPSEENCADPFTKPMSIALLLPFFTSWPHPSPASCPIVL
uniref:Reverse transcriptase Ty1/copia-type domain-containing protein n=1 Tax=Chromera velia CCMP2878 TaxID=1169474 RepID=A0A0G4HVL7_9ALVE|eukprot:Cvel_8828.t1-p1 / transcript=Cvel_8828.t1 / gene=Cvel_8828 / organism=Chromera_velia_CCMP2878 / gene_product=hypothetical protein / transcript_product=hypothetical protein / location=Cvel_scaffold495:12790-14499(+) / protein_length=570 / sequence_SO=supercontig / SO=protein_coding / is_pseudo=false